MSWIQDCYSRLLIDNHISDQKPEFMGKFSPQEYARLVDLAGVESSMVYACDHNGNCYYPTKVGHFHQGLRGRDIFGETVAELRRRGIQPVAYYTATYNNDAAARFPEANIRNLDGSIDTRSRYHYTCPNHQNARDFYKAEIGEILQYDVEGIFIDMSFWPGLCFCDECQKRFGRPIPKKMDWHDPEWIAFQRFREASMAEFAQELTDYVRKNYPGKSVVHQFSPVLHGWHLGQSDGIAEASDYASGDFYGAKLQQRLAVKVFDSYSIQHPFEFMTSRCVNLRDHTSTKCDEELFLSALTTLANGGAYFFIDAINPDGTLHEPFYRRLGELNRRLTPFRQTVCQGRARLEAEVGVYFSMANGCNRNMPAIDLEEMGDRGDNMAIASHPVLTEVLGTTEFLTRLHIPYRAVSHACADQLAGLKVLFLNNATFLSKPECQTLREFVRTGGTLIATGESTLLDFDGTGTGNFQLSDVFGVDFTGDYSPSINYTGEELISATTPIPYTTLHDGTTVRAWLNIPEYPINDPVHYASIHSNPPGVTTKYPAVTENAFGAGKCLWIGADLLAYRQHTQRDYCERLLKDFLPQYLLKQENLACSAELTHLKCQDGNEIICIVNQQDEWPVIPLTDITITVLCPKAPREVIRVSDGTPADATFQDGTLTIHIPRLQYGEFYLIRN